MLSGQKVLLEAEGFRRREEKDIVEEFVVCTQDYHDSLSFLPPPSYSELSTQQIQSFSWLTRVLNGVHCDRGNYLFVYPTLIFEKVFFRNPCATVRAREENVFFNEVLECSIVDLNSLEYRSTPVNYFAQNCRNESTQI